MLDTNREAPQREFRLDEQVGHLLHHAYHRASAHFARRLRPYRLKPRQFATLARLREMGPTSQNCLGEAVGMARANIHAMVERLQARGFVTTSADPADARRRIVELSGKGGDLLDELIPLDLDSTADALAAFDADERRTLYALLRRIG
jgi:DNA-binding MarR family transcriptional regulator